jgi:hypothetical protein
MLPYALKGMGGEFSGHVLAGPFMAATGRTYSAVYDASIEVYWIDGSWTYRGRFLMLFVFIRCSSASYG